MEIVGKGKVKGAVWVARRVPDGCIGGHANQARITTFPHDDPEDTRFSADLVTWAQSAGYYPAHAAPEAFDFSAAFNPIAFHGARYGEVRVRDFRLGLGLGLGLGSGSNPNPNPRALTLEP